MTQVPGHFVKQFVGQSVSVALCDGRSVDGHLVSFDGRSLWLYTGADEDLFVPVAAVSGVLGLHAPATASLQV